MRNALAFILLFTGCNSAVQSIPSPGLSSTVTSVASSCTYQHEDAYILPDPKCTPGAIDITINKDNIHQTICVPGYSAKVRPPVSFTRPLKLISMQEYGAENNASFYEFDHLVSLELGGSPKDTLNLWAQPGNSPNLKDSVENKLHELVCSNILDLSAAQSMLAKDWVQTGRSIGVNIP